MSRGGGEPTCAVGEVVEGEVDLGSGVTDREWVGEGEANEELDWSIYIGE